MAVRIKDGMIPYTGGIGIEITNNHVINVLLRELNNLIQVNEDNELYVDLQLPDGIEPDDDFPVGVTTGKILAEDGWQQSGIILNRKTTSGDYVRFIYANDGKLYYDPGTGQWIEIGSGGGGVQINVATASTLGLIKLGTDTQQLQAPVTATSISGRTYPVQLNADNQAVVNIPWENTTYTAGNNITIVNGEISATIPPALVYKGTVNDISDLPSSGQTVGDTYFVEGEDGMYSWDGTQWNYVGGTGIDTSNFFDKRTDTSDDIVQGLVNLFVTQQEKNIWNNKQDTISAGDGINITNNVVSNTLPFDPDNSGTMGQILQKTSAGYEWRNFPNVVTSVNGQSGAVTVDEFEPDNAGTTGQVLKKTQDGYEWQNESAGSYTAGHGINVNQSTKVISNSLPFEPSNTGSIGQVIKKTATGYQWANESGGGGGGGETYYAGDGINIDSNNVIDNTGVLSVNNQTGNVSINAVPSGGTTGQVLQKTDSGYAWMNAITDANVKQWTINSNSVSSTTLKAIHDWVIADANNGAIIGDSYTNDVFLYHHTTTGSGQTNLVFYGVKRTSQKYTSQKGDYTEAWQLKMVISYNGSSYSCVTSRNTDDATVTNYLSVEGSGYTTPFIPTDDYQPTSKKYVDDRAVPTTGTTGYVLTKTANGYGWAAGATGDVTGPASSTSNHLAVFDGTTGKVIKDGGVVPTGVPSGGSNGQVLTIVSGNPAWANASGGSGLQVDSASPIQLTKIRAGTQAQYDNLGSYTSTEVYLVI